MVQAIAKLLKAGESDLQEYCVRTDPEQMEDLFQQMWNQVRDANLYSGQPRNVQSSESVEVARLALAMATAFNRGGLLAEAWSMMAYALNANEDFIESLPFYRQAIRALEEIGEEERAARIRLGFMIALSTTGQSREALQVADEAGRIFRARNDRATLARLATNLGAVQQRLDDYERALHYHSEAAELFKELGDERGLAQAYLNLGCALSFLDRFAESEEMYANCEALSSRLELHDLRDQSIYNKAYLYFLSGRLSQAIALYRDVRTLFLGSGSHRHAALCDLDEAEIYIQLRLPHDALLLAQAASDAFSKLDLTYEQGKAIAFAGVALTQKRQFGDAITAFRTAQNLLEQEGNAFWSAQLDLYRAEVLFSIRRLCEAHTLASSADAKFRELACTAKRVVSLVLLGRVSLELGRLEEAELHARTVRELLDETKVPLFLFACHALLAEIAEREGRFEDATKSYEKAAHEIELRHTHLHHDELGITFYKGKTEVFESLVHLILAQNQPESLTRAFTWCEKAKSQMFVDALAPHLPSVRSHADEALLARVDRIRGELNSSYLRLSPEFLATNGFPKGVEVQMKEDELVRTLSELSKSDSEYVSLHSATSVGLDELQQSLPAGTTVIEYFFTREEVLAFVITKTNFKTARHLTTTKRVQYLLGRLQHQLKKFASGTGQVKSEDELLREFYLELCSAVMPLVEPGHLVVIPHGLLHRVPFHAFHDGGMYLADRFDISYAPSGSVLNYCLARTPVVDETPLVISGTTQSTAIVRSANARFIRIDAPIALRQDNPVLSGLEFTDGTFCIPDIYSTRWNTNIVSLCMRESSVDLGGTADDLLGLSRALLYAGSRAVLLELWRARRGPADAFFDAFYSEWLSGKSKQEAMRSARNGMRQDYPHPFHWAPFVLTGQP